MKILIEGMSNETNYKPYPTRPQDRVITIISFLIDGREAQKRYTGKLLESELREYSLNEWFAKEIIVTKIRYYTRSEEKELYLKVK